MGWLKEQKKEKEEAEKRAKKIKEEKEKYMASLWESAESKLARFLDSHFVELIGKKAKNGKKIRIDLKNNSASLMAGEDCIVQFYIRIHKHKKYVDDTGGYGWYEGTGEYYVGEIETKFCQPYKDGVMLRLQDPWSNFHCCSDRELANYLMQFIDV